MNTVTLRDVVEKAAADKDFFQSLLDRDPDLATALRAAGMELSAEDVGLLEDALTEPHILEIDLADLLAQFHDPDSPGSIHSWAAGWGGVWRPMDDPPAGQD